VRGPVPPLPHALRLTDPSLRLPCIVNFTMMTRFRISDSQRPHATQQNHTSIAHHDRAHCGTHGTLTSRHRTAPLMVPIRHVVGLGWVFWQRPLGLLLVSQPCTSSVPRCSQRRNRPTWTCPFIDAKARGVFRVPSRMSKGVPVLTSSCTMSVCAMRYVKDSSRRCL
jgi:hypothetical protein